MSSSPHAAIVEAARALRRAGLAGDVEVHLESEAADLLLRDAELQSDLLSPTRFTMPARSGFAGIGTVRVGDYCIRIYERLA